jgi:hypothetical protein
MDPTSVLQNAYQLTKLILQKLEQAKRNSTTVAALADDVADGARQLLEVQDMARRSSKVLLAIESAVRGLHGLLAEIRALADSISAAPLAKRWWQSGDDEQKITDLRGKLKLQLQLLMGAASLKVGVHNANELAELQRQQQRAAQQQQWAAQQQQFGFGGVHERLDEMERQWQQRQREEDEQRQRRQREQDEQRQRRQREEDERIAKFMAQVLNSITAAAAAAGAGGVAAQLAPTLTLADLPEAGLSKLQEAARSRMTGCGAAEAQVSVRLAVRCAS